MSYYYSSSESDSEEFQKKIIQPPDTPSPSPIITPEPEIHTDTTLIEHILVGVVGILGGVFYYLKQIR